MTSYWRALVCALLLSGALAQGGEAAPYSIAPDLFDQTKADLGLNAAPKRETVTIFKPGPGTDHFSNGVVLMPFKGKLYAQWQSSPKDEDSQDTWVAYSVSEDGLHWSKPAVLAPAGKAPQMHSSGGWWTNGKKLVAYINVWPTGFQSGEGGYTDYRVSTNGKRWSGPRRVMGQDGKPVPGVIEQDPHAMAGGRLITAFHTRPGTIVAPFFTDNALGTSGWRRGEMQNLPHEGHVSRELEPSTFVRGDCVVMMFRDQTDSFRQLASESCDAGATWATPVLTDMPDSRAKQSAGNLPDGTAFLINAPRADKLRNPLAITLSRDGKAFDRAWLLRGPADLQPLRFEGLYKRPGYHYPKSVIWNGYLYVGYATNKEDVELTRVPLAALQTEPQPRWSCYTANDAQARKKQVEHGMLPHVVFDGESKPASIESRMQLYKTPALSVAVVHDGTLDWSAAWGQLQTGGAHADCGSLFQAGSIAKPATVLAALRMKSAGLIDFDKSIETYLSSYHLPAGRQTETNPVTFRNLFAHTAGITPGGYAGYAQNEPIPTDQQIVRGEAPSNSRKVEVLNTPGASLSYSGGGYTVTEIALQDQLHKPFDQIMREWLLAPVGMRQADFTIPLPAASNPHAARGHLIDGTMVPGGWNNYPEQAAAGLWATATDLAMLLVEIRKGYEGKSNVFTQASIRELLANPIENHVYGFRLIGEGDQVFITHYGGTVGYRAGMTLNVRTGDGAVFLANSDDGSNLGDEFLSAVARANEWPTFREEKVKRIQQPAAVLQSLAGTYVFPDAGWTVSVVYERDSLTLVFPKGDRLSLVMVPIEGRPREFVHETGVHATFDGEGKDMKIRLFGQTGQRQAIAN